MLTRFKLVNSGWQLVSGDRQGLIGGQPRNNRNGSWGCRKGDPESTPAKSIPCGCSLPVLTRFGRPGRVGPSRFNASNDAVEDFRRAQAPR